MIDLKQNINEIQNQVDDACSQVQRAPNDVNIIAVTKTVDSDMMRRLYGYGLTKFGENRADVFLKKQSELSDLKEIEWHYIGNLQRRKVKDIINKIDYFHALDSIDLAIEINKRATHVVKCFLEVNVSGESSKHGISIAEVDSFLSKLVDLPNVQIVGFMTMAPFAASSNEILSYFTSLQNLRNTIKEKHIVNAPCTELSMGMSHDYPLAIEAGATFVRIGTAFFKDN